MIRNDLGACAQEYITEKGCEKHQTLTIDGFNNIESPLPQEIWSRAPLDLNIPNHDRNYRLFTRKRNKGVKQKGSGSFLTAADAIVSPAR